MSAPAPAAAGIDSRRGWQVAYAVAVAAGLGFGIAYSFGTFFKEMAADFHASRGATALVFGITIFLFFGLGIVSGPLSDRYGPRRLLVAAGVCMGVGLLLTSRVHHLWLGYLTYGIGVGVGAGLYITPCFAVVGGWFEQSRAMALGVASAGSGLGTLLIVPTSSRLIDAFGWRTAYVILGVTALIVLTVLSRIIDRPPVPPPPQGRGRLAAVSHTAPFRLLFVSALLMSISLFVAFAFIAPFAEDQGISSTGAAVLVGIVGASSLMGRLALSRLTERFGPVRLYQGCIVVQPLAYLVWMVSDGGYGLLVVFAVILGVSYGGYVALGPTVAASLFGVIGLGGLLGLLYFGAGLGGLVGPPLAGALADSSGGQTVPIAVCLGVTVIAALVTLAIPVSLPADEQVLDVAVTP